MNMAIDKNKIWIPTLPDGELNARAERIKPIVRFDGELRYIKSVDIRNVAYTWEPKSAKLAKDLTTLLDITTYHTYGYHGLFKPSIAEVLCQIPTDLVDKVFAFEIIVRPETAEDLNLDKEALNAGYHIATTRLYGRQE